MEFVNLRKKVQKEIDKDVASALANYSHYLTEKECEKITGGKKTAEDFRGKIEKKVSKLFASRLSRITAAEQNDKQIVSISIAVEWTKSRMWGSNPKATVSVEYTNGFERFESGSISGCGYDKESTATGQALTQCNALMQIMFEAKNFDADKDNREIFGYGSGYGILPYFEGGVGFSCHRNILERLGFKYAGGNSGKTFDVYNFHI